MNRRRVAARIVAASLATAGMLVLEHDHGSPGILSEGLVTRPYPTRPWTIVGGRHWQLDAAPDLEAVDAGDDTEALRGACPRGTIEVRGAMRLDGHHGPVELLQDTTCVDWISREFPERCGRFDAPAWREIAATLPTRPMHFCIDAYEYPDRKGENPIIGVTWDEAVALCQERAERLCTEDEWTFACEGDDALPYPYGYWRDPQACVIDRPWRAYDDGALVRRDSPAAIREIDYLWQGEASGSREGCRSPFGVRDMTGNVDEWTVSVQREGLRSILKGGYWGPVRARCRASTRVHSEDFYFYQQGFRCCADAPEPAAGEPEADGG